jgi:hypothetical protein
VNQAQTFCHHREVGTDPELPRVPIGSLVHGRRLPAYFLFANLGSEGEIYTSGEWRVDVDKVDLARKFLQQRPHYKQVVTPDKLISPFPVVPGLGLVEDFRHLEGEIRARQSSQRTILVVLARPDQFCFGDLNFCHHSPLARLSRQAVERAAQA